MPAIQKQDPREIKNHKISADHIDRRSSPNDNPQNKRGRSVLINIGESPLSWLYAHKHLSEQQFLAGEKLRSDYERAALGPNITMSWNDAPPSKSRRGAPGHMEMSESMMLAKERFDNAMKILGGGLDNVAWRVICNGESVSSAEKALAWPTRSGKLVLKLALDRLASYYHIK